MQWEFPVPEHCPNPSVDNRWKCSFKIIGSNYGGILNAIPFGNDFGTNGSPLALPWLPFGSPFGTFGNPF